MAYDRAGRVAYRETHWRYAQGDTRLRLVLYRCADGRPFARKHMRWQPANEASPDFDFLDQRDGYREGLISGPDGREVYWQPSRAAEERRARVVLGPDSVVDAGFDNFVRRHWDTLVAGEPLRTAFLLPADLAAVPVVIRRVPGADPEPASPVRFAVELDRWYAFAVPALSLTYSPSGRRLQEFQGAVTIRDDQGKRQKLRVAFSTAAPSAAAQGDIAAAAAEPLAARCREP